MSIVMALHACMCVGTVMFDFRASAIASVRRRRIQTHNILVDVGSQIEATDFRWYLNKATEWGQGEVCVWGDTSGTRHTQLSMLHYHAFRICYPY